MGHNALGEEQRIHHVEVGLTSAFFMGHKFAIAVVLLCATCARAQMSSQLARKHGKSIISYVVSEHILTTTEYTTDGQVCMMRLHPRPYASENDFFPSQGLLLQLVNIKWNSPQGASPRDVANLCESVKNIEVLPFKDEVVADPAYNALVAAGEDAIPCLIRKISDDTVMKDPRQAPKVGNVAVGDTAFFVLVRIAKISFVELLPPDVRKAYEGDQGVYGYFKYINENDNRKKLQDAAVKWYEKKYGRSLP